MSTTNRHFDDNDIKSFFTILKEHQERNLYCDFTLVTGDTSVECHKLVLASCSGYFNDIFSNTECETNIIDVSPMKEEVLNTVVSCMYNQPYTITDDTILDLFDIGLEWNLVFLTEQCHDFVKHNVSFENACYWYEETLKLDHSDTSDFLNKYIRENFTALHEEGKIEELNLKNFCNIIQHDQVNVENEDVIFRCSVRKIEENLDSEDVITCYELIRFEHMSSGFLLDVAADHPLMRVGPQKKLIKSAMKYQCNRDKVNPGRPARFWGWHQMYLIIKRGIMCTYDPTTKKWMEVDAKPSWMDGFSSITSCNNEAIVVGANHKNTGRYVVMMKLSHSSELISLPDLPVNMHSTGVVFTGKDLYVIGGKRFKATEDSKSVYHLRLGSNTWEELPPMIDGVHKPLTVRHNNLIYVMGGRGGWFTDRPSVQEFNTQTGQWRLRHDMPHGYSRCNAGVVVYQGKVRVITPTQCMTYEADTDSWSTQDYKLLGGTVQAMVHKGNIWACVKYVVKLTIMKYDFEKNTWSVEVDEVPEGGYTEYFFAT